MLQLALSRKGCPPSAQRSHLDSELELLPRPIGRHHR
jgi:hypothetical protein